MKKAILYFCFQFIIPFAIIAQCTGGENHYEPALLYKYWQLKERFNQHFIKMDLDENGNLTGDGIGVWDADNYRYTKAGYSLPIINHFVVSRANNTTVVDPVSGSFFNSDGTPGVDNIVSIGGDNTYAMGMYIAMLASEYALLDRNGQVNQKNKTLNELFLALQAIRRLDMTANQLAYSVCECEDNAPEQGPLLSGYSGFLIRADAPANFHTLIDKPEYSADWRAGGTRSFFASEEYYESIPCNFREEKYRNRIAGQDQMIGLLFGFAFVKKFIPEDLIVTYGGTDYPILHMAQVLAHNMVLRLSFSRIIRYPSCDQEVWPLGSPSIKNKNGGDTRATFYGMKKVLNYISPNSINTNWEDFLAWKAYKSFALNGLLSNDNTRMAIEIMTAADFDFGSDKSVNRALRCGGANLMQLFAWYVLHDERIDYDFDVVNFLRQKLCALGCEGNCNAILATDQNGNTIPTWNGVAFDCSNTGSEWCSGERWKHSCSVVNACAFNGKKSSAYDYMLAYNLYHLAISPDRPYFNPFVFLRNDQHVKIADSIIGPNEICSNVSMTYCIDDDSSFENIEWQHSNNLELQSPDTSNCITIQPLSGTEQEKAWLRVSFQDGTCKKARQKNIWLGDPDPEIESTVSVETCIAAINLKVKQATEGFTYNWTVSGPDYFIYTDLDSSFLGIVSNNAPSNTVSYSVDISNTCGSVSTSDLIQVPVTICEEEMQLRIYPNPVNHQLNLELLNAPFDLFQNNRNVQFYLMNQYSTVHKIFDMSSFRRSIDVSDLPNGLYFLSGKVGNQLINSSPFIVQH